MPRHVQFLHNLDLKLVESLVGGQAGQGQVLQEGSIDSRAEIQSRSGHWSTWSSAQAEGSLFAAIAPIYMYSIFVYPCFCMLRKAIPPGQAPS